MHSVNLLVIDRSPESAEHINSLLRNSGIKIHVIHTQTSSDVKRAQDYDSPVLILDEPTDGLDPNQKYEVRQLIKKMAKDKCIVISTHILEEVEAICTRTIIIDRGKILVDSTPKALKEKYNASLDEVFRKITGKKRSA